MPLRHLPLLALVLPAAALAQVRAQGAAVLVCAQVAGRGDRRGDGGADGGGGRASVHPARGRALIGRCARAGGGGWAERLRLLEMVGF